jgi:TRIAD3 protein (E3 ubiquitin-protein ligase RNF216)
VSGRCKVNQVDPAQPTQTLQVITGRHLQTLCNQFNAMKRIEEDLKRRTKLERSARPPRSSALAVDQVRKERAASAVECSCCFEQVPIDDMVACRDEGHLFCSTCLQTYVENQVFGNGNLGVSRETKELELELKCFHGDDCASGFDEAFFEKALPSKVLGKLYAVQGQVNIEQAGLANVCTCPQCGFRAVLDTAQKVFSCPVDSCQFVSCRYCGEDSHSPLPCEQVKKETEGRLTVEEAMSVAIIRKCPTCSQQFVKLGNGCNKVRCGCGTKVCYVCQKEIRGYEHFDNGKCGLYTNIDKDDARARREAGLAAVHGLNRSKQDAFALQIKVDGLS